MIFTPALKWPGGKARLIPALRRHLPADRERLIAPFVGAGALELNSDYPRLVIGDINPDLVSFYRHLKQSGQSFIAYCAEWFDGYNSREAYDTLRRVFNTTTDRKLKAALFLYLNRHGYNGLCRYTQAGRYNVPYGQHKKAPALPLAALERTYERLRTTNIMQGDFEALIAVAGAGDAVYADPPYLPLDDKDSFTAYSGTPFTGDDHRRLAKAALAAARRGAVVVVSNHNVWLAREIYREGKQHRVKVQRSIGASASSRGKVDELIVVYR